MKLRQERPKAQQLVLEAWAARARCPFHGPGTFGARCVIETSREVSGLPLRYLSFEYFRLMC